MVNVLRVNTTRRRVTANREKIKDAKHLLYQEIA
jgi:hypothetical protein